MNIEKCGEKTSARESEGMTYEEFNKWKRNGNFKSSHARILQVSNHIAEGEDDCYTKREAAEVATYWSLEASRLQSELASLKTGALLKEAEKVLIARRIVPETSF
jgi:hypothetical protein